MPISRITSIAFILAVILFVQPRTSTAQSITYPEVRRSDHVDVYHDVKVSDLYRWLEADVREADEVAAWVEAQNAVTFKYLESIPEREKIRARLEKLWNYEKYSTPFKRGGRYYYFKNDGLQNQSVLYAMETLESEQRVLVDPNTWSEDGTVALAGQSFSDDGRYMAYSVAEAGSDWRKFRVMEIETGRILPDEVKWVKFSGAAWTRDGKGFFYGRFDEPEEGADFQALNLNQKLYYHRVGTSQDQDALVYHRPDRPKWGYRARVSEDGRYLVIQVSIGTDDRCRVLYKDLAEPYGMPVDLIDDFDYAFDFLGNDGPVFYFETDFEAARRRLIAIDTRSPERENWRELVAEREEAIQHSSLVGNIFICTYRKDVLPLIVMYALDGAKVREVDFPEIGSVSGFGGKRSYTETFYSFQSFATPPSTYRYDLLTGEIRLLRRAEVDVIPEDFEVSQVFYKSKDGTRIPMFVVHRMGIKLDGSHPTLLYAYGGFDISLRPSFSVSNLAWVQMGGVYAMANLRGGGEYGKEWHKAGTKLRKQNVFDDFIAGAEWLIDNNYTRPEKLAVKGGSNGGLLVGAVMTQRPDLFGACLPAVGVMDMLRFHKFTAGRYWVDDYGSSDDAEEFHALLAYSPYHNLKPGTRYPATLVTTADTDDRVVPMHSFKFASALQRSQAGDAPVLIRIETRAGHGAGKPTSKRIDEAADQIAFLFENLDMGNGKSPRE